MNKVLHHGFVARGITPRVHGFDSELIADRFEVKQAAIDCARLMAAARWTEVECVELFHNHQGFPMERRIEWREQAELRVVK